MEKDGSFGSDGAGVEEMLTMFCIAQRILPNYLGNIITVDIYVNRIDINWKREFSRVE